MTTDRMKQLRAAVEALETADMRAVRRWREAAPGRELTLPDHADLCVWLLEERDRWKGLVDEWRALGADNPGALKLVLELSIEHDKQLKAERDQLVKRVEALEAALRETFRMLTESGMQCNHPEEDGKCGNIDDCMYHSILQECDRVTKL